MLITDGKIIDAPGWLSRHEEKIVVVSESGCWIWVGCCQPSGYGKVRLYSKAPEQAHRAFYIVLKGPIPDGLHVRHTCDVRCCVNPDHLVLGTPSENMQDMARRERGNTRRLRAENVKEIRERYALGATQSDLSGDFGVAQTTISQIVTGKSWRHVS